MKTRLAALALCLLTLILCTTPVIVAEVRQDHPITIKTELVEGDVLSRVKLSRGELWFKTEKELEKQRTQEVQDDSRPTDSDYSGGPVLILPDNTYPKEAMMQLMNVSPDLWDIPDSCTVCEEVYLEPQLWETPDGEKAYAGYSIFSYRYRFENDGLLNILLSPADAKWSRHTGGAGGKNFVSLRMAYGNMDSRVGNVPAAILVYEDSAAYWRDSLEYEAYFVVGNTAYEVFGRNIEQKEFIELLISIIEAPRPETRNVIECILEG